MNKIQRFLYHYFPRYELLHLQLQLIYSLSVYLLVGIYFCEIYIFF